MRYVTLIALALIAGCNSTQQEQLKVVTQVAMNHAEAHYEAELAKCPDPNDCPDAEKIAELMFYGETFLTMLDEPLPEDNLDRLIFICDKVIESTIEDYSDVALYVADIRIILTAIKEGE